IVRERQRVVKLRRYHRATALVDVANRRSAAMIDRYQPLRKLHRDHTRILILRRDHYLASLVDESPVVSDSDRRHIFGEWRCTIELRIDRELSVVVDESRSRADRNRGQSVRKSPRLIELRRDLDLSAAVHVSVASAFFDQKQAATLLTRPRG